MFEEVGLYDAKTKLSEMLQRVEVGQSFTITNRGKPVADLIPSRSSGRQKAKAAIRNILEAQKHKVPDSIFNNLKEAGIK